MPFEPIKYFLDINHKLINAINDFNVSKIMFNNSCITKDEFIEVVGNYKINQWEFTLLINKTDLLEMWSDEAWWVPM